MKCIIHKWNKIQGDMHIDKKKTKICEKCGLYKKWNVYTDKWEIIKPKEVMGNGMVTGNKWVKCLKLSEEYSICGHCVEVHCPETEQISFLYLSLGDKLKEMITK